MTNVVVQAVLVWWIQGIGLLGELGVVAPGAGVKRRARRRACALFGNKESSVACEQVGVPCITGIGKTRCSIGVDR